MMRIGFEAKRAFCNRTGLGNYCRTVIGNLHRHSPDERLFLYSPRGSVSFFSEPDANVFVRHPHRWCDRLFPALWRSYRVADEIAAEGLDLYHGLSHEIPFRDLPARTRTVVTIHDLIYVRFPEYFPWLDRRMYDRKFRHACRRADRIIAVSEQTKNDVVEFFGTPPEKIEVVYQSCDDAFIGERCDIGDNPAVNAGDTESADRAIAARYGVDGEYLLSVGSLIERKNALNLVEAFRRFDGRNQFRLVLVGQGKAYRRRVEQAIADGGLNDRVSILTQVAFADLPALYRQATALLYPSVFEGFGIPIIEALFSGTPVITSQGGCFAEAAGPGALYVDPLSPDEICAAIARLTGDTELRGELVARGREHVARFRPENTSWDLMRVYMELSG